MKSNAYTVKLQVILHPGAGTASGFISYFITANTKGREAMSAAMIDVLLLTIRCAGL